MTKRTVSFQITDQWYGTEAEYAEARQLVRRLIAASWARAFTLAYGNGRTP